MPVQTAVTAEDVEALALEAERALQATAAQSAAGLASLTFEDWDYIQSSRGDNVPHGCQGGISG